MKTAILASIVTVGFADNQVVPPQVLAVGQKINNLVLSDLSDKFMPIDQAHDQAFKEFEDAHDDFFEALEEGVEDHFDDAADNEK
jgi:hypothetical protein